MQLKLVGRRLVPSFAKPALRPIVRRALGHASTPPDPEPAPSGEPIVFPLDVSDEASLRRFLAGNAAVFGDPAEAEAYLSDALLRFRVTMTLVPELPASARVLELGANPYFITRLLQRRGLDVTCANWFNEEWGRRKHRQVIPDPIEGDHVFEFDHFNIERDRFPYPDDTFDLVLFCEILEHLPQDPIHALAEIHRVLRKGRGSLILTTPNAVRAANLVRLQRGENFYEQLSGYGAYGRHNREYTVRELRMLLEELGYRVDRLFDLDVHGGASGVNWSGAVTWHRQDNLFCVAAAQGEPRWRYPAWLYASTHSLYGTRLVRPDLTVGLNDVLQSSGLYPASEIDGQSVRWTSAAPARVLLEPGFSGPGRLAIEAVAPAPGPDRDVRLTARSVDSEASWMVVANGAQVTLSAPFTAGSGRTEVELRTDRTWSPEAGNRVASPRFGIAIHRVALVPD